MLLLFTRVSRAVGYAVIFLRCDRTPYIGASTQEGVVDDIYVCIRSCMCVYTQAAVDEEGEGRGGSVQLLTGGRRVSQASPTLSAAILEPSPFVTAVTRQSPWTSRFMGYIESTIFVTDFL